MGGPAAVVEHWQYRRNGRRPHAQATGVDLYSTTAGNAVTTAKQKFRDTQSHDQACATEIICPTVFFVSMASSAKMTPDGTTTPIASGRTKIAQGGHGFDSTLYRCFMISDTD